MCCTYKSVHFDVFQKTFFYIYSVFLGARCFHEKKKPTLEQIACTHEDIESNEFTSLMLNTHMLAARKWYANLSTVTILKKY